jgi:methanogenic corrinoid protein MtbC1
MISNFYGIKYASKKSGLSVHTIRAWEKRYKAISPQRTNTNRRLYTEKDIEKLSLLKKAINLGHSIGRIANLEINSLQNLLKEMELVQGDASKPLKVELDTDKISKTQQYIDNCLENIKKLEPKKLELLLRNASSDFGTFYVLTDIISPLVGIVGDLWREGKLRIAHEHLASEVIKSFLKNIILQSGNENSSKIIVVTTPKGQIHDVGATLVAATCAIEGWTPIYLGPNLPYEEIVGAVKQNNARALALSIVYPEINDILQQELKSVRGLIDKNIIIFAGGRATISHSNMLADNDIEVINDLAVFRNRLLSM